MTLKLTRILRSRQLEQPLEGLPQYTMLLYRRSCRTTWNPDRVKLNVVVLAMAHVRQVGLKQLSLGEYTRRISSRHSGAKRCLEQPL